MKLCQGCGQLVLVFGILAMLVTLAWFFFVFRQKDTEKIFGKHANRYAKSVAFVLTEYWITAGENRVYQNRKVSSRCRWMKK